MTSSWRRLVQQTVGQPCQYAVAAPFCALQIVLAVVRLSGSPSPAAVWIDVGMLLLLTCLLALSLAAASIDLRARRRRRVAYRRSPAGNVGRGDVSRRAWRLLEREGIHLTHVPADGEREAYTHTVGLAARPHPELVVTGPDPRAAADVLADLVDRVARGALAVRRSVVAEHAASGRRLALLELDDAQRWVPVAERLHGSGVGAAPVRAYRVVAVGDHAAPDLGGLPVLTLR
ncbi:DUF4262 domain-containing protein [Nocardioides zeae]|uniref:DUF4262 domain-containing protein n=1 Tax=Nocardioides imazamoxiresistens TaxID=3231893 RepID=A0ABU3Q1V5_9ACTN|nr:DUF4262 domain-containing protein [Nocardioides zeae]MDT9595379.1 DUF4262 domain-containing protein [Nocardioides zeae]